MIGQAPISWAQYIAPLRATGDAEVRTWEDELKLHHLAATWRAREVVEFDIPVGCAWKRDGGPDGERAYCREECPLREARCHWRRKVLLWAMDLFPAPIPGPSPDMQGKGEWVNEIFTEVSKAFEALAGQRPVYAFMKTPVVDEIRNVLLVQADWVPDGFVALWSDALR